jgi:hypothetical protein
MVPVNDSATRTPSYLFTTLIEGLYTCVSDAVGYGFAEIPLAVLLWRRLHRMYSRFAFILARLRAGTLPAPGSAPRRPAPARPAAASPPSHEPLPMELPRRFGWVTHEISMAVFRRYDLEDLLEDPEMPTLVAAAPQLGSVLRPLCHMMAIRPPPWLRLPRRPRRRIEKHPPAPDWLVNEPGAMLRPDGSVWMRLGASTIWRPGSGQTLAEAQKFDRPRRIWPRED